jgi:peroxiredoxin Q/BCP
MSAPVINRVVGDFKATATRDKTIQLKELRGQNVVIYFYPKDSTPGCTLEGQDFRDLHAKFRRQNTVILGVSRDSVASHEKFREKQQFPFDLISDPDEAVCRHFDVIHEKTLYGRKFMGIVRSTFLINTSGKLQREWRKVKVKGHADEVFDAVKAIK